ncbi:MAG: imidazole glycerol phosphate synthase subunit HisF [Terriglobales bacterium]
MLTRRIIACLDVDAGRVVKGTKFLNLRDAGDPAELARAHAAAGADEIVFLDITATHEKRGTLVEAVRRTARELFIPLTVGGGIRTLDDAAAIFDAGCDKISINSAAVKDPALITHIAERFGSQAVVVAIDAKRIPTSVSPVSPVVQDVNDYWRVYVSGGRIPTERGAVAWAREAEARGAGEILLTSMDRDGTGIGFDCELTAAVAQAVSIPVIASGGAGSVEHFVEVFQAGKADAALAASIFHFGIHEIRELKQRVAAAGIPMRYPC